jgi:hypothetical protein
MRCFQVTCEFPALDGAYAAMRPWLEAINATKWDETAKLLIVYVTDEATELQTNSIGLALLGAGCGPQHERIE